MEIRMSYILTFWSYFDTCHIRIKTLIFSFSPKNEINIKIVTH